jgi:multiple sugar transport system substrate-binding protein
MSWDEVFNLARQMSKGEGKDAIFGLTFNSWSGTAEYWWDIEQFMAPLQLKVYDDQAERMTVNTPQWKKIWQTVYDLHEANVIPSQEDLAQFQQPWQEGQPYRYNPFQGRPFFQGRVAMTVGDYSMINDLQTLKENAEKIGMEPIEWDVVSTPYHDAAPGVGMSTSISSLFAINAKAQNPEDAWEFVKFMNGEEWAKFKSRSTYEMSTRKEYIKVREGMSYNVEAFTKMQPAPWFGSSLSEQRLLRERPNLSMVNELVNMAYNSVFQKQRTVDEALAWLEEKGNDLLQRIKANPEGTIEGFWEELYGNGGGGIMPLGKGVRVLEMVG